MIGFKRAPGWPDQDPRRTIYPHYYLWIWRLHIEFHRSGINYHSGDYQTPITKGGRIINLKCVNGNRGTGYSFRFIKYFASGAWCYLDVNWNRRRDN